MKIFVRMTILSGQGAKVGAPSDEIAIDVPDKSWDSYQVAHKQAVIEFCKKFNVKEPQVLIQGCF